MDYRDLLQAFGAKMESTAEFVPDDAGVVELDVGDVTLSIIGMEDVGQLILAGVVGVPPPEEKIARLYRTMLEANDNYSGTLGATLSLDAGTGDVRLVKAMPLAALDGDILYDEVNRFSDTLGAWRKIVSDYRDAPSAAAGGKQPPPDIGKYLQV